MDEVRDLCVLIDSDLLFHSDIRQMVARAFITGKFITKTFCVTQYLHIHASLYCLRQTTS